MSNNQIAQFLKNDYNRFKDMVRSVKIVFTRKRSNVLEDSDPVIFHASADKRAGEFVTITRSKYRPSSDTPPYQVLPFELTAAERLSHGMPKEFHVTIPM